MTSRRILWCLLLGICLLPLGPRAEEAREPTVGEEPQGLESPIQPSDAGTVSSVCGTSSGTRFNREARTNARPQHTTSVDFLRSQVAAGVDLVVGAATDLREAVGPGEGNLTGYYVSRDADCAPEFEGRLPPVEGLRGQGSPVVAADPARDAVFIVDLRAGGDELTAVGLFRTTAARLLNATACPTGTHTAAQASTCWPTSQLHFVNSGAAPGGEGIFTRQVHVAVDQRASGVGAGNVYIAAIVLESFLQDETFLELVTCTNDLTQCSDPVRFADITQDMVRNAHVAVRPDDRVSFTWAAGDVPLFLQYRSCTPARAPTPPTCGPIRLVHGEPQPLFGDLATQASTVLTRVRHDHRVDVNGTETYVVWDRCKVELVESFPRSFCPEADVVMKASRDDGVTWSALAGVNNGAQDQFMPAIKTDRSRNIVSYSSTRDPTFQHRVRVILSHINPGSATPDPVETHVITTLLNDPSGDPFRSGIGSAIGVAARGSGVDGQSRAYVHYTYHNIQGTYNGVQVPEANNHLSRLDY